MFPVEWTFWIARWTSLVVVLIIPSSDQNQGLPCKSLQHLVTFLDELHSKNVDLFLHRQGIDTTTPAGKMMFQILGVFAEFERAMIKERINAGLSRARAQGKKLGGPRVSLEVESKIRELRSMGRGIRKIAGQLRVGVSTVKRVVDEQKVA